MSDEPDQDPKNLPKPDLSKTAPERRKRVVFDKEAGQTRATPERVKTARRRSAQSTRWIERQINDPYVKRAKAEGWRSRAVFKLMELDEKFKVIPDNGRVIDLGAAPGGWTQLVARRGAKAIVGIDLLPMDAMEGVILVEGDFLDEGMDDRLVELLGGKPDLVLSDMASNTVGHKQTDHIRTATLADAAAHFALKVLAPGGAFVTKVFQGGGESDMVKALKIAFKDVRHAKPPSSRAESVELFLVATGFKG
jgi:23S rRNA (uridine2552-2'-O)-methyltransferase